MPEVTINLEKVYFGKDHNDQDVLLEVSGSKGNVMRVLNFLARIGLKPIVAPLIRFVQLFGLTTHAELRIHTTNVEFRYENMKGSSQYVNPFHAFTAFQSVIVKPLWMLFLGLLLFPLGIVIGQVWNFAIFLEWALRAIIISLAGFGAYEIINNVTTRNQQDSTSAPVSPLAVAASIVGIIIGVVGVVWTLSSPQPFSLTRVDRFGQVVGENTPLTLNTVLAIVAAFAGGMVIAHTMIRKLGGWMFFIGIGLVLILPITTFGDIPFITFSGLLAGVATSVIGILLIHGYRISTNFELLFSTGSMGEMTGLGFLSGIVNGERITRDMVESWAQYINSHLVKVRNAEPPPPPPPPPPATGTTGILSTGIFGVTGTLNPPPLSQEAKVEFDKARISIEAYRKNPRRPDLLQDALNHLNRGINLAPDYAPAYKTRANVYKALGDFVNQANDMDTFNRLSAAPPQTN